MDQKIAVIIGAGPAGLTAAYELIHKTNIKPIILEKTSDIGGLSKTVNYKGNRIDIGGHRFFSKSDKVMKWWLNIFPLEKTNGPELTLNYQNQSKKISTENIRKAATADDDQVMLIRKRVSHIYYLRKFFTYPITLSWDTLSKLGLEKIARIFLSYTGTKLFPRQKVHSLEDFLINRFGKNLYRTFFKDYTEKVWGVPCSEIPAEWGVQRIKGLSVTKAIFHAVKKRFSIDSKAELSQKNTDTTLIQHFLYPKYGPGQLWEEVARLIIEKGGEIYFNQSVCGIATGENNVVAVEVIDSIDGQKRAVKGDYFFSTMPVKELIAGIDKNVPTEVAEIARNLSYRDFITVGLLVSKFKARSDGTSIKDNWIYVQEKEVRVGRLQIFNNWSPFMVKDADTVWLGLEYFCNVGDEFWNLPDDQIIKIAIDELVKIDLIRKEDVLDHTIIRMEKTYPAYFGSYSRFYLVRQYIDNFRNLFLIGRNGMHKYNNADHSMLTAMAAVENIIANKTSKDNIWAINTEQDYQETE